MLSHYFATVARMIQPHRSKEHFYRFLLVGGMAALYYLDYLSKMHLDTYGANLYPAFERLGKGVAAQPNYDCPAPTLSQMLYEAHHCPSTALTPFYEEVFWAIGETVLAHVVEQTIIKMLAAVQYFFTESAKIGVRSELLDGYLGEGAPYVMMGGPEPRYLLVHDVALELHSGQKISNRLVSEFINGSAALQKLWKFSGNGHIDFGLMHLGSVRIPGYAAIATVTFAAAKAVTHYVSFYTKLSTLRGEHYGRVVEHARIIGDVYDHGKQKNALQAAEFERRLLQKQQEEISKLNNKYFFYDVLGSFFSLAADHLYNVCSYGLACIAIVNRHIGFGQLPAFIKHCKNILGFFSLATDHLQDALVEMGQFSKRIQLFQSQMDEVKRLHREKHLHIVHAKEEAEFGFRNMTLALPDGSILLEPFSHRFEKGAVTLLNAPSGSGKSTLINTVTDSWPHGRGEVVIPEGKRWHIAPQEIYLPLNASLLQALFYPVAVPETVSPQTMEKITGMMRQCQLGKFVDQLEVRQEWGKKLSGGEKKRLALIQSLLKDPDILILDEVMAGVDAAGQRAMRLLIKDAAKSGKTVLIIEHMAPEVLRSKKMGEFLDAIVTIDQKQFKRGPEGHGHEARERTRHCQGWQGYAK